MKTVVTNSEVVRLWAEGKQDFASNAAGTLYFNYDVIYSYGEHFPIARYHLNNVVLFTTKTYSVTTARHCSDVLHALSTCPIPVYNVLANTKETHRANFDHMKKEHADLLASSERRRHPGTKAWDLANAAKTAEAANKYSKLFKLRVRIREERKS